MRARLFVVSPTGLVCLGRQWMSLLDMDKPPIVPVDAVDGHSVRGISAILEGYANVHMRERLATPHRTTPHRVTSHDTTQNQSHMPEGIHWLGLRCAPDYYFHKVGSKKCASHYYILLAPSQASPFDSVHLCPQCKAKRARAQHFPSKRKKQKGSPLLLTGWPLGCLQNVFAERRRDVPNQFPRDLGVRRGV